MSTVVMDWSTLIAIACLGYLVGRCLEFVVSAWWDRE